MKKRLTDAQYETLVMLLSGPKATARYTHYDYVCGSSAQSLVKKGYARRLYELMPSGMPSLEFQVAITDEGIRALYESEGK